MNNKKLIKTDVHSQMKKNRKAYLDSSLGARILTYVYCFILAVIIIFPILITVLSAFKEKSTISFTLDFSGPWTLSNFTRLFTETFYLRWYFNTVLIAVFAMVLQVAIVTLAGYVYSRFRFPCRKYSLVAFLIVQMIPTLAALVAFYVLGDMIGGINQFWYLTLIYVGGGIPMNTWLMKGYFDSIPISLDESAKLDGASNMRIFFKILLPLVKPMVAVQALWAFMGPFTEFMLAKFILSDQQNYTVAVGLQTFIADAHNQRVVLFAAGAILIALPICLLFFALQKHFVSGLLAGGTKG
jgi:arabinogalactan oligomer/maltooligosaccharide transport system permease protein